MARAKKAETTAKAEKPKKAKKAEAKPIEDKEPEVIRKNGSGYKTFAELTEEEVDTLIFYECFCAELNGNYKTSFSKSDIKSRYGNCTFPPFVLNMMKEIQKFEHLKSI